MPAYRSAGIPAHRHGSKKMKDTNKNIYLILAFIEGCSVMAIELFGAKMAAIYYGNSLYVWTSILSVAVAGLAAGYFSGGFFSSKFPEKQTLFYIFFAAS